MVQIGAMQTWSTANIGDIMEYSLLFQSFMIFYLLEVLVLAALAWKLTQEYREQKQQQEARNAVSQGPSPSDLIKMRAKVRELQRQQE